MALKTACAIFLVTFVTCDLGYCDQNDSPGKRFGGPEQQRQMLIKENCLSAFLARFQSAIERDARKASQHFRHETSAHRQSKGVGRDVRAALAADSAVPGSTLNQVTENPEIFITSGVVAKTCSTRLTVRKFGENCTVDHSWCLPTTLKKCVTPPMPVCNPWCPPFLVGQSKGKSEAETGLVETPDQEQPALKGEKSDFVAMAKEALREDINSRGHSPSVVVSKTSVVHQDTVQYNLDKSSPASDSPLSQIFPKLQAGSSSS